MRRHEALRDWHLLLLGKTLHFLTADRSGEAQCPQAEEQKKKNTNQPLPALCCTHIKTLLNKICRARLVRNQLLSTVSCSFGGLWLLQDAIKMNYRQRQ